MRLITWQGLEFAGDERPATYTIEQDGLSGFLDGVGTRGEQSELPTADGDYDSPLYLTGRSGSMSGLIHADSSPEYEAAIRRITGLAVRSTKPLFAGSATDGLWCSARRQGDVDVTPLVYGRVARYMLQWYAPDPRWYGKMREFAGTSVDAWHAGNAEAFSIIEVAGNRPGGYTVSSQGRSYVVTKPLVSGAPHRIDMRSGWLYVDGAVQVGAVARAETFMLPPGGLTTVSLTGSGSGSMTVKVHDTYV